MNAITLAAVAALLAKQAKANRDHVEPGEHTVQESITLHLDATVKVSEDSDYTPTAKIPLKTTLALFYRYSGITGPAALAAMEKAMHEALRLDALPDKERKTAIKAMQEMADLTAAEKAVRSALDRLPLETRNGAVRVTGKCDEEPNVVTIASAHCALLDAIAAAGLPAEN